MNLKSKLLILLMASAGFAAQVCAQSEDPFIASLRKSGEIKGAVASAPPMLGISPTGKATGYLADITNMALKGMGLPEVTPTLTAYASMIPALQAKQVDLVLPVLQTSEERCKAVLYSAPVFLNRNVLFVKAGNPKQLTTLAYLAAHPEIKVATAGGVPEQIVLQAGVKRDQLVTAADNQAGLSTVSGGRADVFVGGQFSFSGAQLKQLGFEAVVDPKSPMVGYGIVVRKEDVKFRDALSEQLNAMRANGKMKEAFLKLSSEGGFAENVINSTWDALAKLTKLSDILPSCE